MRKVYGVGVKDVSEIVFWRGQDGKAEKCPFYAVWHSMMTRCYSQNYLKKRPAYLGTSVCEEWHMFSQFKTWMEGQDWKGKQLDKDLKGGQSKVYSPDTCCFVPGEVNNFLEDARAARGDWPLGVYWNKTNERFLARISIAGKQKHIGSFECPEEAHRAWKKKKFELAVEMAAKLPVELRPYLINRYREEEAI